MAVSVNLSVVATGVTSCPGWGDGGVTPEYTPAALGVPWDDLETSETLSPGIFPVIREVRDSLEHRENLKWWARSDSNRGPRDSLDPAVSGGSGLSLHPLIY